MKPVILLSTIFCILILFSISSQAQQINGTISGFVTDFVGSAVPGAIIKIKIKSQDAKTLSSEYSKTTSSDYEGNYNFQNVPPGIYEININSFGGMSHKTETVRVLAKQLTKLNFELSYGGDCENSNGKTIELDETDKAEIINQILDDALIKKQIPDYSLLAEQKGAIILSNENIKADWVKPIKNVNLKLMSQSEIQSIADNKSDFLYLSFDKFKIKGECVIVTFTNSWAVGKKSGMVYLSGGGSFYRYHKENGKLIGESIGGWIS